MQQLTVQCTRNEAHEFRSNAPKIYYLDFTYLPTLSLAFIYQFNLWRGSTGVEIEGSVIANLCGFRLISPSWGVDFCRIHVFRHGAFFEWSFKTLAERIFYLLIHFIPFYPNIFRLFLSHEVIHFVMGFSLNAFFFKLYQDETEILIKWIISKINFKTDFIIKRLKCYKKK